MSEATFERIVKKEVFSFLPQTEKTAIEGLFGSSELIKTLRASLSIASVSATM